MFLSGVVRNRKEFKVGDSLPNRQNDANESVYSSRFWDYFNASALLKNFTLRVHKFTFKWDLVWHLSVCLLSLSPFAFSGNRGFAVLPFSVWLFYNALFWLGSRANLIFPGFGRVTLSFRQSVEDLLVSPKLLPVLSGSFLLVTMSLYVTGKSLGGPPLCYSSCSHCLSKWQNSQILLPGEIIPPEFDRSGCGYKNGKEMLGYYTIAQTSFLQFITVIIALSACLAWRVAVDEADERTKAEEWLKKEDPHAFRLREDIMKVLGAPGSNIRPEGNPTWVSFGLISALTFTLLGWHNWYILPPSNTATFLIILNLATILTSSIILHLGFFGRLLALYKRNLSRVRMLTEHLHSIEVAQVDIWWNTRNFILNEDLALDYDTAGLAVSATFVMGIIVAVVLLVQTAREGFGAILEAPGSYCAYAVLYITMCLMKILSLATETFQEQMRHITGLQALTMTLLKGQSVSYFDSNFPSSMRAGSAEYDTGFDDYENMIDNPSPQNASNANGGHSAPNSGSISTSSGSQSPGRESQRRNSFGGLVSPLHHNMANINVHTNTYTNIQQATAIAHGGGSGGGSGGGFSLSSPDELSNTLGNDGLVVHTHVQLQQQQNSQSEATHSRQQPDAIMKTLPSNNANPRDRLEENIGVNVNRLVSRSGSSDVYHQPQMHPQGGLVINTGVSSGISSHAHHPLGGQRLLGLSSPSKDAQDVMAHPHSHSHSHLAPSSSSSALNNLPPQQSPLTGFMKSLSLKTISLALFQPSKVLLTEPAQDLELPPTHDDGSIMNGDVDEESQRLLNPDQAGGGLSAGGDGNPSSSSSASSSSIANQNNASSTTATGSNMPRSPRASGGAGAVGAGRIQSMGNINMEAKRQTLAEMVSQIRKYDPYPCILGIPVMPSLFVTAKFYIFLCFVIIGARVITTCMRLIW